MAGAVPPAGQHMAAVRVHQPAGGARGLARVTGRPGVQQCGSPGEVHHHGTGTCEFDFPCFGQRCIITPVLHNLHFVLAKSQVPPTVEDEHKLDQEIYNTVRKIIRDFVTSWYSTVSSESGFETEVQEAMISMAMELKIRAGQLDRKVI